MTTRQAVAMKHIVAGDSVSKAMTKAGYKPAYAKNPQQLTRTKSFIDILEKAGVSDKKLAQRLNEGLDATNKDGKDFNIIHKYIETNLRLKGHSKDTPPNTVIIPIYGGLSGRPDDVPLPGHNSNSQDLQTQAAH
jgi:hypothetical protein